MLKMPDRTTDALAVMAVLAACALMLSCSSEAQTKPCPGNTSPYNEYRLFFGRGDAGNPGSVSDEDWEGFLGDTITKEFPAGLTILDAYGQYTDTGGTLIKEDTKVLIILFPRDEDPASGMNRVMEEYIRRFDRESVLFEIKATCASFESF